MRLLVVGDVIAQPGITALQRRLPQLRRERGIDFVIANGENAAPTGLGLTVADAQSLFAAGVDVITSGNHIWDRRGVVGVLEQGETGFAAPHYSGTRPGRG